VAAKAKRTVKSERLVDLAFLVVSGVASSAFCLAQARQIGPTFDEPAYVERGLTFWKTGSHAALLRAGTMPLPADLETLPAAMATRAMPLTLPAELGRALPAARAVNLVFWWVLLLYALLTARSLAGPWAGRLAALALAAEPSFLAHASLATTDIAASATLLALAYHFRKGRDATPLSRVVVPGLWFGAALLSKASALVFGPTVLLVLEWERVGFALSPFRRDLRRIVAIGLAAAFLWCGSDFQTEPSFVAWARALPEGAARTFWTFAAEHLRLFPNAGEALVRQVKHNLHGHGAFLLGHTTPRATLLYFPAALTMKLSLPLLLALPALLLAPRRALRNGPCLAALALVVLSLTYRVQTGIRFVLPAVAFGIVGLAAAAGTARAARPRLTAALASAAVLGAALSSALVWPDTLCFTNALWGGTANGYRLLSDSNYDWGQGLPALARWSEARGLSVIDVWYFGTDPAAAAPPFHVLRLHENAITKPADIADIAGSSAGRYLAVSTTLLWGTPLSRDHERAAAILRGVAPAARTATFLIYEVDAIRRSTASPARVVESDPPASTVASPARTQAVTASSTRRAGASSPRARSIIAAVRIDPNGFAIPLPARGGAEP
jgi:Dolichyl-phosphate-mannose-protein mannosyltransferase